MALVAKNPLASAGDIRDAGSIAGLGRSPGEGKGNPLHPVFLPGESPWTEDPGGLQSIRSQSQTRLKRFSITYINSAADWLSHFESY